MSWEDQYKQTNKPNNSNSNPNSNNNTRPQFNPNQQQQNVNSNNAYLNPNTVSWQPPNYNPYAQNQQASTGNAYYNPNLPPHMQNFGYQQQQQQQQQYYQQQYFSQNQSQVPQTQSGSGYSSGFYPTQKNQGQSTTGDSGSAGIKILPKKADVGIIEKKVGAIKLSNEPISIPKVSAPIKIGGTSGVPKPEPESIQKKVADPEPIEKADDFVGENEEVVNNEKGWKDKVNDEENEALETIVADPDMGVVHDTKEVPKADVKEASDEEEEEAEIEEDQIELPPADPREHCNIVFIGHVDAGKSTLSGSILYQMGTVDERTIDKYKREAKETNRESWFLAFIMDTNEEERAKGKTVEVGRATFCTEKKRYTMLDAPGHKNYVPAMIAGAAQADIGILVISARKGEFEAGFDRLGQTREHAMLAKTLGVQKLIVVVNKMDEVTVKWSKERFDECVNKLTPFLKQCGFKVKKQVIFMPISAITGVNVRNAVTRDVSDWAVNVNDGLSLIQTLDGIELMGRDETAPLRVPVLDKFVDRGICVMGKIEAGYVLRNQKVLIMPFNKKAIIDSIQAPVSIEASEEAGKNNESEGDAPPGGNNMLEQREVSIARVGENVTLRLKNVNEEDLAKGFVICSRVKPLVPCVSFMAMLQILELLPHRNIFTAGYRSVLHVHTAIEECVVKSLLKELDPATGKPKENFRPRFVKSQQVVWARIGVENAICIEPFSEMMALGRFTLRDEGKTIAIGKVIKIDPMTEA